MKPKKLTMTSVEAAALLSSGGATDDPEMANMMADGRVIDPDRMERAFYRRAIGFDFSVLHDANKHRYIVRDDELNISVTCGLTNDEKLQSSRLAKAVMKLKKLHDKKLQEQTA